MADLFAINEVYAKAFRDAITETAPPCPDCGGVLVGERVERYEDWHEQATGDLVVWAGEFYRCRRCGVRVVRRLELDRETAADRVQERENAIGRAELRCELRGRYGILGMFRRVERGVEAEVQRRFPFRPDVDLMARYVEARDADTTSTTGGTAATEKETDG